ncbi:Lar family restriction alleviation protein [Stenotrophomonas maltophilia]|uniref:Lar family restriction alleviation protein n=1 Tax=Stenotrophomonas maltophilia TaxID=40324 RepID=UPI00237F814C|nr:Lar family restriction alleviation protein [Stenotrophomonas maltophilia]WDW05987.1 Lar family restriction alleviation protein [Stenotrophomonas maltophilia]
MDVEQIDLLPCPFCGAASDSLIVEHLEGTILHPAHRVRCDNCGASSGYTDHACREAWNTRAALTPPEGWVLMPRVLTEEMLQAGYPADDAQTGYEAMIAVRPEVKP